MIKVKGWELSCFRFHEEMIDSKFMFQNVPKSLNFCTTWATVAHLQFGNIRIFFFAAETFFLLQVSLEKPRFLVSCDLFTPPKNLIEFLAPRLNEERDVHFEDLRNEIAVAQSIWPGEAKKVVPWNWSKRILQGCKMLTHLTATVETWDRKMRISRFSAGCRLEAPTKRDGLKNCFPKSFEKWYSTL